MYYFAYGSNMDHSQMKERCFNAKFLSRAVLEGYRFVYDGNSKTRNGPVANIVVSERDIVWGGLFEIDDECIRNLDVLEGIPRAYQKKELKIKDDEGRIYNALVYLREPREVGKPNIDYKNMVVNGAHNCGLPEGYITEFLEV